MIPEAKIRGLRQALEAEGKVTFTASGATVELVDCERCEGKGREQLPEHILIDDPSRPCRSCDEEGKKLRVSRGHGGHKDFTIAEAHRAYDLALNGPPPKRQPPSKTDFGDDPPF